MTDANTKTPLPPFRGMMPILPTAIRVNGEIDEQSQRRLVQIPLRSLIARDGRNLMMAGRNVSADRQAQSSALVATSGAMMGQAVGIAAALAAEKKVDVRDLDPKDVRKIVLERGAKLDV